MSRLFTLSPRSGRMNLAPALQCWGRVAKWSEARGAGDRFNRPPRGLYLLIGCASVLNMTLLKSRVRGGANNR